MIDSAIRARLLELPGEYRAAMVTIVVHHGELAKTRAMMETRKAEIVSELAVAWRDAKTNEQTRNADVANVLAENAGYQDALGAAQGMEETIKAAQLTLDALHFEFGVLSTVANNDQGVGYTASGWPGPFYSHPSDTGDAKA